MNIEACSVRQRFSSTNVPSRH